MLNRAWWQHLAPKSMHRRLSEVEKLLSTWCKTQYGQHWLMVARKPAHVLRVFPGQPIPVVHFVALGELPIFIAPQSFVKHGHRFVGTSDFASSRPLDDAEMALTPSIRLDVVTDEALIQAASQLQIKNDVRGVKSPSIIFSTPAHYLLSPDQWPNKAYALYQHIFGGGNSYPDDGFFYIGITKRRWQTRWAEHLRGVQNGSQLLFHRKLRQEMEAAKVTYLHHKVMAITDNLELLYNTERFLIEGHWDDERRLNMIPGGKAGLRYMRDNLIIPKGVVVYPDGRDGVVTDWLRQNNKGLPPVSLATRWQDEAWAEAQICSRSDRLTVSQVTAIRTLAGSHEITEIAERTGATPAQIQRVTEGKSYSRVR